MGIDLKVMGYHRSLIPNSGGSWLDQSVLIKGGVAVRRAVLVESVVESPFKRGVILFSQDRRIYNTQRAPTTLRGTQY